MPRFNRSDSTVIPKDRILHDRNFFAYIILASKYYFNIQIKKKKK